MISHLELLDEDDDKEGEDVPPPGVLRLRCAMLSNETKMKNKAMTEFLLRQPPVFQQWQLSRIWLQPRTRLWCFGIEVGESK